MTWQTVTGDWLLRGRAFPIQLSLAVARVRLPDGRRIRESCEFFLVDAAGRLCQRYRGPVTSTVDDELYVFDIHEVIGDRLLRCTWIENYRDGDELRSRVCLAGLREAAGEPLPFDPGTVIAALTRP